MTKGRCSVAVRGKLALIQLSHNSICAERYALGHYLGQRQKFYTNNFWAAAFFRLFSLALRAKQIIFTPHSRAQRKSQSKNPSRGSYPNPNPESNVAEPARTHVLCRPQFGQKFKLVPSNSFLWLLWHQRDAATTHLALTRATLLPPAAVLRAIGWVSCSSASTIAIAIVSSNSIHLQMNARINYSFVMCSSSPRCRKEHWAGGFWRKCAWYVVCVHFWHRIWHWHSALGAWRWSCVNNFLGETAARSPLWRLLWFVISFWSLPHQRKAARSGEKSQEIHRQQ